MKTILFICHGNICRSPAAEFIMKDALEKRNLDKDFYVFSRATSLEEIGNDIYPPMKAALRKKGIKFDHHCAERIDFNDYKKSDFIFYMDSTNSLYLSRLIDDIDNKFENITKYSSFGINHIEDPWYSDRFDLVAEQLEDCCENIIDKLLIK